MPPDSDNMKNRILQSGLFSFLFFSFIFYLFHSWFLYTRQTLICLSIVILQFVKCCNHQEIQWGYYLLWESTRIINKKFEYICWPCIHLSSTGVFFCYIFTFIFSFNIEGTLLQIFLVTGQFHSSYYSLSQGMLSVLSSSILVHQALLFRILEEYFEIWSFCVRRLCGSNRTINFVRRCWHWPFKMNANSVWTQKREQSEVSYLLEWNTPSLY